MVTSRLRIRLSLGKKLGVGITIVLLLMVGNGILFYRSMTNFRETTGWRMHAYQVIDQLITTHSNVQDIETGGHAFAITGDTIFLAQYRFGTSQLGENTNLLRQLISDNPGQVQRLDSLEPLMAEKRSIVRSLIDLRQKPHLDYTKM